MDIWITIIIGIVLVVSFFPVVLGLIKSKRKNGKMLRLILAALVSFNSIWYFVLFIGFARSNLRIELNSGMAVIVIQITIMFFIRFIFLLSFLRLFRFLMDLKWAKGFLTALKISGMAFAGIMVLGLLEFLVLDSYTLSENLILYTDILIFFIVIVCCIYILCQVNTLYSRENQKAVKILMIIFIIPVILGFLKWLAGGIAEENTLSERLSIPVLVFLLNISASIWLLIYGNKIATIKVLKKRLILAIDLIEKYKISKRETEVIQLICEGYTNRQIADELFISVETVKDHNSRIFLKTEVNNRTQLAKLFMKEMTRSLPVISPSSP